MLSTHGWWHSVRVPIVVNEYIEVVAEAAAGLHVLEDRPGGGMRCYIVYRLSRPV